MAAALLPRVCGLPFSRTAFSRPPATRSRREYVARQLCSSSSSSYGKWMDADVTGFEVFTQQIEGQVDVEHEGMRLDTYLYRRNPTYYTRDGWWAIIKEGRVKVRGRKSVKPSMKLKAGDFISVTLERERKILPPLPDDFRIPRIYMDRNLAAFNKPAGILVHPTGSVKEHTVTSVMEKAEDSALYHTDSPTFKAYVVHRLDRETTGVLVLARHAAAARALCSLLGTKDKDDEEDGVKGVSKEYLVAVEGHFQKELVAEGYMGPDLVGEARSRRIFSTTPGPPPEEWHPRIVYDKWQSAATKYESVEYNAREGVSLVKATLLHGGRTHQIRATLASLGFPVVGDLMYGVLGGQGYIRAMDQNLTDEDRKMLRIGRVALHAHRLCIRFHSLTDRESEALRRANEGNDTQEEVSITADLPEDMAGVF